MKHRPIEMESRRERLVNPPQIDAWLIKSSSKIRKIIDVVSDEFFTDPVDIIRGSNTVEASEARMVCYWVLSKISRLSHIQIAHRFGRKDHSAVSHALAKIEGRRSKELPFREITDDVLAKCRDDRPKLRAVA